ncbi:hypothetical protein FisN_11Hh196 [Fistulifera solaris]|uniref:WLM domain-containing protein n=1 Tax=Fistulifera solaris TaxID=1519565 RepID=A0A1Z5JKW4_FISSO|nr:hypothetical protein FisN_11Hh196 [Fistulifera solaris]|eukprot:GAX14657.1 hypothetical protein FisN_11Hh196 [Fistulifera solaris]
MSTARKRIRTVRDLAPLVASLPPKEAAAAMSLPISDMPPLFVLHQLPQADSCKALMERVVREFLPIIMRRGYKILSVSEFCCCGDGLDALCRRKKNQQPDNVLGYNQTLSRNGNKSHEIHLRMRHVHNHGAFYDYEDIAGTFAHELAHCERGPHDKKFFEIMEGILEEHAKLLASRLTMGNGLQPMLPFSGSGQRLGGGNPSGRHPSRLVALGHKLGGDCCFQKYMTPSEAAVAAAQARQRQLLRIKGTQCCQPCVIDLSDEDDDESTNTTEPVVSSKKPAFVDLTSEDTPVKDSVEWSCRACTYLNPPIARLCGMCETARA